MVFFYFIVIYKQSCDSQDGCELKNVSFCKNCTFTRLRMQQKHLPVHSGHALQSLPPQAHFTLHGLAFLAHHFWHWSGFAVVENDAMRE